MLTKVSVTKARELDLAMFLLEHGRITYGRWVEVLGKWVREECIDKEDFGEAESIRTRIFRQYRGKVVTTRDIATVFCISLASASSNLSRLCQRKQAIKIGHGKFSVNA